MSISAVAVILLFQLQDMELTPETAKLHRAEVVGRVGWVGTSGTPGHGCKLWVVTLNL